MTGRCRFCGCTQERACPSGCSWENAARTVCSECVAVARAWSTLRRSRKPNMTHAFFRGFALARVDDRAGCITNPYPPAGQTSKYFYAGFAAGRSENAV